MQTRYHTLPSASMNIINYESTGYNPSVSYIHPGNPNARNEHLDPSNHTTNSYPLPSSDTINYGLTNQHFGITNNSPTSYILTYDPASHGYLVMKVDPTRTVWRSAADINRMLGVRM